MRLIRAQDARHERPIRMVGDCTPGVNALGASWLFNADETQIQVVIHPESVIHSLVDYIDGSMLAQLGNPDMRTPIAFAP